MIKSKNVERALHLWQPWTTAVSVGRQEVNRLKKDIEGWSDYSQKMLRDIRLPKKLLLQVYYLCCVFSDYDQCNTYSYDAIQLPQFLYPLADKLYQTMAHLIWRHAYVDSFLRVKGTRLRPDLDNLRNRPYPPAIWNRHDVKFILERERHEGPIGMPICEIVRRYYRPCYMVLADDHPLLDIASNIKRKRDESIALLCAQLKDQGYTYVQIGERFDWKLRPNPWGVMTSCSTARRYVKLGRQLAILIPKSE